MIRIAVDFDGTIVENAFPSIGKEQLFAFETLKMLQKRGFLLILWTYRVGRQLDEAVEFCRKNGVEFYAVNRNYPEEVYDETISRKIDAEIYIDDKNIGGFPGWTNIWGMLFPEEVNRDAKAELRALRMRKKSFWNLFRK